MFLVWRLAFLVSRLAFLVWRLAFNVDIAEGSARKTAKDQAIFSTLAYSSTIELLNDLIITQDLNMVTTTIYEEGRNMIEQQTLLVAALRKSQQRP